MLSIFRTTSGRLSQSNQVVSNPLVVDFHARVLPYLDDGSESIEQSVEFLQKLAEIGYKKVIAAPHIMYRYPRNTPEKIEAAASLIRKALKEKQIAIDVQAAAEYYLDEHFLEQLRKESPLLAFGEGYSRYVLFETSLISPPKFLFEAIELIKKAGYKPVLAHPEQYVYLQKNFGLIEELALKGVLFQVSFSSLFNYKNKEARKLAVQLIDKHLSAFLATNSPSTQQLQQVQQYLLEKNWHSNTFLNAGLLAKIKSYA